MEPWPTLSLSDNTSTDNMAMDLAATRKDSLLDVLACFISGRAAHSDPKASIEERDDAYSAEIQLLNTKRMKGFLHRAGRTTRVFKGEEVYRTQLRTVIPHELHANEHDYDPHNDWMNTAIDGNFADGLRHIREYKGSKKWLVLVGGPCTELALIMRFCPDIVAKIGTIVIQAGDFAEDDSSNLLGGKGNSFNGAVDSTSLHDVLNAHKLFGYKGKIFILSSNITKQREIGLTIDDIVALGVQPKLREIYRVHAAKRGGMSYIHDLGLVMLAEQLRRGDLYYPYRYEPVEIVEVPYGAPLADQPERRGTIVTQPATTSNCYVVTWQDTVNYRDRVAAYLQS